MGTHGRADAGVQAEHRHHGLRVHQGLNYCGQTWSLDPLKIHSWTIQPTSQTPSPWIASSPKPRPSPPGWKSGSSSCENQKPRNPSLENQKPRNLGSLHQGPFNPHTDSPLSEKKHRIARYNKRSKFNITIENTSQIVFHIKDYNIFNVQESGLSHSFACLWHRCGNVLQILKCFAAFKIQRENCSLLITTYKP